MGNSTHPSSQFRSDTTPHSSSPQSTAISVYSDATPAYSIASAATTSTYSTMSSISSKSRFSKRMIKAPHVPFHRKYHKLKADHSDSENVPSPRLITIAARFWQTNIDTLNVEDQLEIGLSVFFGMLSTNKEMKKVMKSNRKDSNTKIRSISMKYLDMMGFVIRNLAKDLNQDNHSTYSLLVRLGKLHRSMGIEIQHFGPMLSSLHDTFTYYFPKHYNIQVQYSIDVIFTMAAQVMTQQKLSTAFYLHDVARQSPSDWLHSLEQCLKSSMGRGYFYNYLQHCHCEEIAIYLQLIHKFHSQTSDKERFMIARDIIRTSVRHTGTFAVNISHECRETMLTEMSKLEKKFVQKQPFQVSENLFALVEMEMRRLIIKNHWRRFVDDVQSVCH